MIVNERIISYIHSLEQSRGPFLDELRTYAEANRVPIIRREVESFLEVLLSIQRPETILELGTAIGYSAIFMGRCVCENSRIVTIENYEKRILSAKENIKKAGMEKKICLIEGDALEEMKKMRSETFGFIFIDAAKAQYIYFLQEAVRLLRTGAVLVADNVLQEGDLIESRYTVTRRDRTIHARMREYMYEVKNREDLVTTVVPIGDGMTVSVKR